MNGLPVASNPTLASKGLDNETLGAFIEGFFRRQEVRSLLPDLKLLLAVIFVSCESHVGCWIPGDLAKDSGVDEESLSGGLDVLEKQKLIMRDRRTGELFILWWFRDNTFKGAQRGAQALADFNMVESQVLREAILDAVRRNPECGLSADFLGGINKNHMVINQGEVEVTVRGVCSMGCIDRMAHRNRRACSDNSGRIFGIGI